jgi:class 3 adenylate cyclase
VKPPPIKFADSPDGKIAYQVIGDGSIDVVWTLGFLRGNLDGLWEHPMCERYLRRLSSFCRLILLNQRGTGLSDPLPAGAPPTFEDWTTDLRCVLDAAGSEQVAVLANDGGGSAGMLFAAAFPERTRALMLFNCYATLARHDDYPWGLPAPALERLIDAFIAAWGSGENLRVMAPDLAGDERFRDWFARLERLSMSPATVSVLARWSLTTLDLRGILPTIKAPTLVVSHAEHPWVRPGHSRYLAEHIPNAKHIERPGFWGIPYVDDVDWTLSEVQAFLTGTRGSQDLDNRVLATVLFTDIVDSTGHAARVGDRRWGALLDDHNKLAAAEIERFRGRIVKSTGDGFLVTFDGPARAIRCALNLGDAVRPLGIEVRTGLHTGEVELRDDDVGGIAVHIAERVMGEAGAEEVLVSGAVPPLVAGSGIEFDDCGVRPLKGVPGEWRLFAVKRS